LINDPRYSNYFDAGCLEAGLEYHNLLVDVTAAVIVDVTTAAVIVDVTIAAVIVAVDFVDTQTVGTEMAQMAVAAGTCVIAGA
jgi:hypothetical protein